MTSDVEAEFFAAHQPRCQETRERAVRGQADPITDQCRLEAAHEGDCDYGSPKEPLVAASPLEWHPEPEEEPVVDTSGWLWVARAACGCIDVVIESALTPEELDNVAEQLGARGFKMAKVAPEEAKIDACRHRLGLSERGGPGIVKA